MNTNKIKGKFIMKKQDEFRKGVLALIKKMQCTIKDGKPFYIILISEEPNKSYTSTTRGVGLNPYTTVGLIERIKIKMLLGEE